MQEATATTTPNRATLGSRRAMLTTSAAVLTLVGTARLAVAAAHPDAELIGTCAAFNALHAEMTALWDGPDTTEAEDAAMVAAVPIFDRMEALVARMGTLRAVTPDGIHARAHTLAVHAGDGGSSLDPVGMMPGAMVRQLMRDATAMGAPRSA